MIDGLKESQRRIGDESRGMRVSVVGVRLSVMKYDRQDVYRDGVRGKVKEAWKAEDQKHSERKRVENKRLQDISVLNVNTPNGSFGSLLPPTH